MCLHEHKLDDEYNEQSKKHFLVHDLVEVDCPSARDLHAQGQDHSKLPRE